MKYYNAKGEEQKEIANPFKKNDCNQQLVKDYLVALRNNARQWSANTKTRSEVNHTSRKPHKQKGTGSARQGSLAAPQYKGGGVVFGPKPKFNVGSKVNKKEKKAAFLHILNQKIENEKVVIVDSSFFTMLKTPKTKTVVEVLQKITNDMRGILFVCHPVKEETASKNFKLSVKNLPRSLFSFTNHVNGYDFASARTVIMSKDALNAFKKSEKQKTKTAEVVKK